MVTPDPPVNSVKNAHSVAAAIAVPPGAQPNQARNTRSSRSDDRPSASRNPASVNSGIAATPVEVVSSWYAIIGSTTGGLPSVSEAKSAMPPSSAKIGAPATPASSTRMSQGANAYPANDPCTWLMSDAGGDAKQCDDASRPRR